ncbi:GTP cyclohydrolase IIa [Metallosphaera tengchongensis]|nr:GTP cyclohydrolase IIa [Metallosphaera tengchongensis]
MLVLELYNYREWTEILGNDREWKIQLSQHSLVSKLLERSSQIGGILLPMRYDLLLIPSDGLRKSSLMNLLRYSSRLSPVAVRACLGYGKNPQKAQEEGYKCVKNLDPGQFRLDSYPDSNVVVAHFDLNGFTDLTFRTNVYDSFVEAQKFYMDILSTTYHLGGVAQYMGGDNIVAFLSEEEIDQVASIVENNPRIKVGIGVGVNARDALRKATKALTEIRKERRGVWKILQE